MSIRFRLREFAEQFDERPAIEKVLAAAVLLIVCVWVFTSFIAGPVTSDIDSLRRQLAQSETQLQLMQQREQLAISASETDPNEPVRVRIARAIEEQNNLDGELQELAGNLVTPQSMTRLLTSILERQSGLTLISIDNSEPVLVQNAAVGADANTGRSQNIFRHSINLELEGDYLSLIGYLRRIEGFPERFFWDRLSFSQLEWPRARISLQLHTLSTEEGFVGV